jgi:predicted amidohydrolase YtcJ
VPRFAALDVVANAQALWACHEDHMDVLTIPFLGADRSGWQYPFGALQRSGARLAMGSDWGVSSPDPLQAIEVAVTRSAPAVIEAAMHREPLEAFLPEQAITLEDAVRAYTAGSAYVNHLDGDTGTIEVGKLADLIVLDRNLFDIPADEIHRVRVLRTLLEGKTVFRVGTE